MRVAKWRRSSASVRALPYARVGGTSAAGPAVLWHPWPIIPRERERRRWSLRIRMGSWTRRAGINATSYAARPSAVGTIRARSGTIAMRVRLVYRARSRRWYATVGGLSSNLPSRVAHASIADIPVIDLCFHAVIPRPNMHATRIQLRVHPVLFSPRSNAPVGRRRLGTSSVHWRGRRSRAERCAADYFPAVSITAIDCAIAMGVGRVTLSAASLANYASLPTIHAPLPVMLLLPVQKQNPVAPRS